MVLLRVALPVHQGFTHTVMEMVAAAPEMLNLASRESAGSEDAPAQASLCVLTGRLVPAAVPCSMSALHSPL